jgi:hypothetical protein
MAIGLGVVAFIFLLAAAPYVLQAAGAYSLARSITFWLSDIVYPPYTPAIVLTLPGTLIARLIHLNALSIGLF